MQQVFHHFLVPHQPKQLKEGYNVMARVSTRALIGYAALLPP